MPSGSVSITGLKELQAKLKKLQSEIAGDTLREAAQDGAYIQQRRIMEIIREKDIIDTGQLLGSIRTEVVTATQTKVQIDTGTNVAHAEPNEFGTWKMAARPFMRPGFDESKADAETAVRGYIRRRIEAIT
jgi:HK97 gp10 family phage protein